MANVKNYKVVGASFSNEIEYVHVRYDFAVDAGATGVLNLITATDALILKSFHAVVKTACVGVNMVLDVGVVGVDTDLFLDGVTVTALAVNTVHSDPLIEATPNTKNIPYFILDAGVIAMEIKTAALTAGVIDFVFGFMKT